MQPQISNETDDYWVINKPAGMAVEPPSPQPTVFDWLIEEGKVKVGEWESESRYGVVHRLDTDTSGVLLWAKNRTAQEQLKLLWQGRQVEKTYLALVVGECPKNGTIELPIERDNKKDRQKVALLQSPKARAAITTYNRLAIGRLAEQKVSLVEVHPITGRTHQIRVHLKAIGHPIIGDKLYGEKLGDQLAKKLGLTRQFLHAWHISLLTDKQAVERSSLPNYTAPLAADLSNVLNQLRIPLPTY